MRRLEAQGEPARTAARRPRAPPAATDLDAFRRLYGEVERFTDTLLEGRCRRTDHFERRLGETLAAFRPLLSAWNPEALFLLYVHGPQRFNGLKRTLGTSSRVLTDKLRGLAEEGLVRREAVEGGVLYALTPRGEAVARLLHPLLFLLHQAERLPDVAGPD